MPTSLATLSALLKEIYEPQMQEQLNNDAVALKRIERSSEGIVSEVGGKYVTFPIHVRRNSGIGSRNEMELLPTAGQQGYASARVNLRYHYGQIQISGQTIELAKTNAQAFANAMDKEFSGLKNDLAKDQNRQVYSDGTGTVAVALGNAASNNITVASAAWAQLDMQVDLVDGTTLGNANPTIKASNRKVTAINLNTNVITIDGVAVTPAAGDIIVRTGNVNRELIGFGAIIKDSGVLQNIDPAVEPLWKAVVDSNGGVDRPISEGLMTKMADDIRVNGGSVTAIFSNLGVRRSYANLLTQQRRYTGTTEFTGGFSGLAFTTDKGDIPFVSDVEAPRNRAYFVNEKEITFYREGDWAFMDRDGSKFDRVPGFDAYNATMYQYSNLGTHRRNSHGLLEDLTEG